MCSEMGTRFLRRSGTRSTGRKPLSCYGEKETETFHWTKVIHVHRDITLADGN